VVNQRLIHDAAMAMAQASLDIVVPCLLEMERSDAINEFYAVCKAGIEAYEIQRNRILMRMNPTRN
jgi:hypothetical protein